MIDFFLFRFVLPKQTRSQCMSARRISCQQYRAKEVVAKKQNFHGKNLREFCGLWIMMRKIKNSFGIWAKVTYFWVGDESFPDKVSPDKVPTKSYSLRFWIPRAINAIYPCRLRWKVYEKIIESRDKKAYQDFCMHYFRLHSRPWKKFSIKFTV